MKLRVTVDTEKIDLSEHRSMNIGEFGCDIDGLYLSWYRSPSYLLDFEDIEVLECKHDWHDYKRDWHDNSVTTDSNTCYDCKAVRNDNGDVIENRSYGRYVPA